MNLFEKEALVNESCGTNLKINHLKRLLVGQ